MSVVTYENVETPVFEIDFIRYLFTNGAQGTFWGQLPYYSDAAGTVEAGWGDPVGFIPDASGNEQDWTQVTSTARPILGRVPVGGRRNWVDTSDVQSWPAAGDEVLVTPGIDDPYGGTEAYRCVANSNLYRLNPVIPGGLAAFPDQQMTLTFWVRWVSGSPDIRLAGRVSANPFPIDTSGEWTKYSVNTPDLGSTFQQIRLRQDQVVDIAFVQLELGTEETPYQRVGNEYDITESGVKGIHYLRFDGTDDQVTTTLPAISGGTIVLAGTNGIWIDSLDFAGGAFSVGPDTYTGGPAGLMSILGDILVGGGFVIDRALTPEDIAKVEGYYKARGSAGLFEVGANTGFDATMLGTGWSYLGDGVYAIDGSNAGLSNLEDTSKSLTPGSRYLLAYRMQNRTVGSVDRVDIGNQLVPGAGRNSNGTTTVVTAQATGNYSRFRASVGAIFELSEISLRRLIMPGETP